MCAVFRGAIYEAVRYVQTRAVCDPSYLYTRWFKLLEVTLTICWPHDDILERAVQIVEAGAVPINGAARELVYMAWEIAREEQRAADADATARVRMPDQLAAELKAIAEDGKDES